MGLPGILEPTGFFDPAGFSEGVSSSELKRYREAELTHGRVAMMASVGFLVGESGATPLFGGRIDGIAINQFWQVPEGFWPVILLFIAVPETFRALRGWMEPTVPENYFQLRPGYIPGDLDFDPAGLRPEDPEEFKEMQTKELQHCRLAMLAAAGMIVQELQTGATLFFVSPSAPASADNLLELKAQESIVRGEVGWSQQSSENSHPLTICGAYDPADFTDVQTLPGIIAPTGFFDPAGLSDGVSPSELKRFREAELTHGRVAMLASLGFLVGESGATPLFGGKIDGIAINQFWKVPEGFWPVILLFIAVPETFRALRGWMEPTVPENYFQLRPGYIPGDLDFDPAGLRPEDPEELKEMQTKELQHCRLAMLAAAGMIVQELQTGSTLFYV